MMPCIGLVGDANLSKDREGKQNSKFELTLVLEGRTAMEGVSHPEILWPESTTSKGWRTKHVSTR